MADVRFDFATNIETVVGEVAANLARLQRELNEVDKGGRQQIGQQIVSELRKVEEEINARGPRIREALDRAFTGAESGTLGRGFVGQFRQMANEAVTIMEQLGSSMPGLMRRAVGSEDLRGLLSAPIQTLRTQIHEFQAELQRLQGGSLTGSQKGQFTSLENILNPAIERWAQNALPKFNATAGFDLRAAGELVNARAAELARGLEAGNQQATRLARELEQATSSVRKLSEALNSGVGEQTSAQRRLALAQNEMARQVERGGRIFDLPSGGYTRGPFEAFGGQRTLPAGGTGPLALPPGTGEPPSGGRVFAPPYTGPRLGGPVAGYADVRSPEIPLRRAMQADEQTAQAAQGTASAAQRRQQAMEASARAAQAQRQLDERIASELAAGRAQPVGNTKGVLLQGQLYGPNGRGGYEPNISTAANQNARRQVEAQGEQAYLRSTKADERQLDAATSELAGERERARIVARLLEQAEQRAATSTAGAAEEAERLRGALTSAQSRVSRLTPGGTESIPAAGLGGARPPGGGAPPAPPRSSASDPNDPENQRRLSQMIYGDVSNRPAAQSWQSLLHAHSTMEDETGRLIPAFREFGRYVQYGAQVFEKTANGVKPLEAGSQQMHKAMESFATEIHRETPRGIGQSFMQGLLGRGFMQQNGSPVELRQGLSNLVGTAGTLARYQVGNQLLYGGVSQVGQVFQDAMRYQDTLVNLDAAAQAAHASQLDLNESFSAGAKFGLDASDSMEIATQALETYSGAVRNGADASEIMAKQTQAVATSVLLTGQTAQVAQKQLNAINQGFGLGDAGEGVNRVNDAVENAKHYFGGNSADIQAAVAGAAEPAKLAGVSVEQTANIAALIQRNTGDAGGQIGTEIQRLFQRGGTGPFTKALAQTGIANTGDVLSEIKGLSEKYKGTGKFQGKGFTQAEKQQFISSLGGFRSIESLLPLLEHGDELQGADNFQIQNQGKAAEEAAKHLKTLSGQLKTFGADFTNLAVKLGNSGIFAPLGLGIKLIEPLLHLATDLVGAFDKLPAPVRNVGLALAEVAGVVILLQKAADGNKLARGIVGTVRRTVPEVMPAQRLEDAAPGSRSLLPIVSRGGEPADTAERRANAASTEQQRAAEEREIVTRDAQTASTERSTAALVENNEVRQAAAAENLTTATRVQAIGPQFGRPGQPTVTPIAPTGFGPQFVRPIAAPVSPVATPARAAGAVDLNHPARLPQTIPATAPVVRPGQPIRLTERGQEVSLNQVAQAQRQATAATAADTVARQENAAAAQTQAAATEEDAAAAKTDAASRRMATPFVPRRMATPVGTPPVMGIPRNVRFPELAAAEQAAARAAEARQLEAEIGPTTLTPFAAGPVVPPVMPAPVRLQGPPPGYRQARSLVPPVMPAQEPAVPLVAPAPSRLPPPGGSTVEADTAARTANAAAAERQAEAIAAETVALERDQVATAADTTAKQQNAAASEEQAAAQAEARTFTGGTSVFGARPYNFSPVSRAGFGPAGTIPPVMPPMGGREEGLGYYKTHDKFGQASSEGRPAPSPFARGTALRPTPVEPIIPPVMAGTAAPGAGLGAAGAADREAASADRAASAQERLAVAERERAGASEAGTASLADEVMGLDAEAASADRAAVANERLAASRAEAAGAGEAEGLAGAGSWLGRGRRGLNESTLGRGVNRAGSGLGSAAGGMGMGGYAMIAIVGAMVINEFRRTAAEQDKAINESAVVQSNAGTADTSAALRQSASDLNNAAKALHESSAGFFGSIANWINGDQTGKQARVDQRYAEMANRQADRLDKAAQEIARTQGNASGVVDLSSPDALTNSLGTLGDTGRNAADQLDALNEAMVRTAEAAATGVGYISPGGVPESAARLSDAVGRRNFEGVTTQLTATARGKNTIGTGGGIGNRLEHGAERGLDALVDLPWYGTVAGLLSPAAPVVAAAKIAHLFGVKGGGGNSWKDLTGGGVNAPGVYASQGMKEADALKNVDLNALNDDLNKTYTDYLNGQGFTGGGTLDQNQIGDLKKIAHDKLQKHFDDLAGHGQEVDKSIQDELFASADKAVDDMSKGFNFLDPTKMTPETRHAALQFAAQNYQAAGQIQAQRDMFAPIGVRHGMYQAANGPKATQAAFGDPNSVGNLSSQAGLTQQSAVDALQYAEAIRANAVKNGALPPELAEYDVAVRQAKIAVGQSTVNQLQGMAAYQASLLGPMDTTGKLQAQLDGILKAQKVPNQDADALRDLAIKAQQVRDQMVQHAVDIANAVNLNKTGVGDDVGAAKAALDDAQKKYDTFYATADAGGKADLERGVREANAAYQKSIMGREQARQGSLVDPRDTLGRATQAVTDDQSYLKYLKDYEPDNLTERYKTEAKLAEELLAADKERAAALHNVKLLALDMTDPVQMAQEELRQAVEQRNKDAKELTGDARTRALNTDDVDVRNKQWAAQQAAFTQDLQDLTTQHDLGEISSAAYRRVLESRHSQIGAELATMKKTDQGYRQLMDEYNQLGTTIKGLDDSLSGSQFNIGDIDVPTPYEMRRTLTSGDKNLGYSDNRVVSITVNGGNTAQVLSVIKSQLGTSAMNRTAPATARRVR